MFFFSRMPIQFDGLLLIVWLILRTTVIHTHICEIHMHTATGCWPLCRQSVLYVRLTLVSTAIY